MSHLTLSSQEKIFQPWQRAIILVDMNAFFASVEQLDHPEWQGRALAITNGKVGTCIITCSYEARAYGIKTGMRLYEAKRLCPHLIQVAARPKRYVEVSRDIMTALSTTITPEIEVFSIDEAFLDVTRCQLLLGPPEKIGRLVQKIVFNVSGLLCSIGVSSDKTTAKFAAKQQKPNGFTIIPPWESKERLRRVPVTELCGIKRGIGSFLAKHGVVYCGDMEKLPIHILTKRFGNLGRRIWHMCQGADSEPVHTEVAHPKTMGHGKVLPPHTRQWDAIKLFLRHLSEKLASRLRHHGFRAQRFFIGVHHYGLGWLGGTGQTYQPTDDGKEIFQLGVFLIQERWNGEVVSHIQVPAIQPQACGFQLDFLVPPMDEKHRRLNQLIDDVNDRFGEFTIAPTSLLSHSPTPNVIAPSWKPSGHRQTI